MLLSYSSLPRFVGKRFEYARHSLVIIAWFGRRHRPCVSGVRYEPSRPEVLEVLEPIRDRFKSVSVQANRTRPSYPQSDNKACILKHPQMV